MSLSPSDLADFDPEFAEVILKTPLPNRSFDPVGRRKQLSSLVAAIKERDKDLIPPASEHRVEEHTVPVDGGEIPVRCIIPTPSGEAGVVFPLLVHYHGGGWISGDLDMDDIWLRQTCVRQQVSIVNVGYRLAPEFLHPVCREDAYAGLKWAADNTELLHASLCKGFIVCGISAGGNLAAGVALRARDDPFFQGRPLTGQVLQIPGLVHPENFPEKYQAELKSMELPLHPSFLNKQAIMQHTALWKPDLNDIITWLLLHPNHAGLPPAVIQVCGLDPLRDEGIVYEKVLKSEGIKTRLHLYPGVPHAFFWPHSEIKLGRQYVEDRQDGIRWLLDGAS